MNIVLICPHYPPEHASMGYMIKELAEDLALHGHIVTIVTGYPNHPGGIVFGGYKKQLFSTERENGVKIIRCYLYTSPSKKFIARAWNYLSFTITAFLATLFIRNKDLVFVSNLFNTAIPLVLRLLGGPPYVYNVQDIYPDVAVSTGVLKNKLLIGVFTKMAFMAFNHASKIVVISEGFKKNLLGKNISADKIAVIPNWVDTDDIVKTSRDNPFAVANGLMDKFVVLYAGTIGIVSGAEILIETASVLTKHQDILILFVGEGIVKDQLMQQAEKLALPNMRFLPFQPREIVSQVQACADVSIVTLKPGKGGTSVPSKILGYLAAGKPIVASVDLDSDTATLIRDANCGACVAPADPQQLAEAILHYYRERDEARQAGENGYRYLQDNLDRKSVTNTYRQLFEQTGRSV